MNRKLYQCEQFEIRDFMFWVERDYQDVLIFFEKDGWGDYEFQIKDSNCGALIGVVATDKWAEVRSVIGLIKKKCDAYMYEKTIPQISKRTLKVYYCSACGAPLKQNSRKCNYCDTEYW